MRTREFDRDDALGAAIGVFRTKGFEGTSLSDLTHAMAIGRQSLYDTFGDKRELYIACLTAYCAANVTGLANAANGARSPRDAIARMLLTICDQPRRERLLGCLAVHAVCEFGTRDPELASAMRPSNDILEGLLRRILNDAKAQGQLSRRLDVATAAQFLMYGMSSLKLSGRAGEPVAALRAQAHYLLDALSAHHAANRARSAVTKASG